MKTSLWLVKWPGCIINELSSIQFSVECDRAPLALFCRFKFVGGNDKEL